MLQANCTDTVVSNGHSNHRLHNHIYKLWFSLVEYMFSVKLSKKIATLSDAMFTIYRIAFRADTKSYPV